MVHPICIILSDLMVFFWLKIYVKVHFNEEK